MKSKISSIAGQDFIIFGHEDDIYFNSFDEHASKNEFLEVVLRSYLQPGAICLDIGANSGLTAFLIDRLVHHAKILCIEPGPRVFGCLKETLAANVLYDCEAVNVCVGSSASEVRFSEVPSFSAGSFVKTEFAPRHYSSQDHAEIIVKMLTIDEIVREKGLKKVDFIKIDVEGFEEDAIRGAEDTLNLFRPLTYIEFNSYVLILFHNRNPREFLRFIRSKFTGVYKNTIKGIIPVVSDEDWHVLLHENLKQGFVTDLLCVTGGDGSLQPNHKALSTQILELTSHNNELLSQNRDLIERANTTQAWADATDRRLQEMLLENRNLEKRIIENDNELISQNRALIERANATQAWADATDRRLQEILLENRNLEKRIIELG